jgi:hypothetical protein
VVTSEPLGTKAVRVRLAFTALPEDAKAFLKQVGQTPSAT